MFHPATTSKAMQRPAELRLPVRAALGWLAVTALAWSGVAVSGVDVAHADDAPLLTPFASASAAQPPAPWRFTSLPNKTPTRFEVVQKDGQALLKVDANQSYGNLVHRVKVPLTAATTLAWRWRVEQFVQDADLRTRAGDDGAAKVCVFFDLPTSKLPLVERTRLALARTTIGEDVPSEALCYVWDNKEPRGASLVNAYTRRMRMVVLESGARVASGGWVAEQRSLLADYQRAFGDEAGGTVPDVVAVVISADADNTHGHGIAYFSDVALKSPPVHVPAGTAE